MGRTVLAVAWFRFRATFRRRRSGYLAIVLLVGLVGGLAMGAIAAARRTQSSFTTFLASTNPSDLTLAVFPNAGGGPGPGGGYSPSLTKAIRGLPDVKRVESWASVFGIPLGPKGVPLLGTSSNLTVVESVDGRSFDLDRAAVVQGRMADPRRFDEFVTTAAGAQLAGWRVGEVVPFGFYTADQTLSSNFATGGVTPTIPLPAKLVGLVQFSDAVVQDQIDRYPTFALFTPALSDRLATGSNTNFATYYGIQAVRGSRDLVALEREIQGVIPPNVVVQVHVTSLVADRTDRAIKPESIALGAFGVIAALAALAIAGQAVARQLRADQADLEVLRALGATPIEVMSDGLGGVLGSIIVGALTAGGVAVALSPLGPIGPVRPVYPTPGINADWAVLGAGVAVMVALLGVLSIVLAYRGAPGRILGRGTQAPVRRPTVANAAARAGLPVAVMAGVRFALEPGEVRNSVPVRSALLGTALAVAVVAATLTFGSGLSTLVSHPTLYGWNWTYALFSETGPDVPPQAAALLQHDPHVAAFSYAQGADPQIDGQSVPTLFEEANATVVPPILSGHAPQTNRQIVLGQATSRQLGVHVGSTVTLTFGSPESAPLYLPPTRVRVVGTATMPAIGFPSSEGDHTSMGTGALIPTGLIPPALRAGLQSPDPTLDGPEFVFVRMRGGVGQATAAADMRRIALAGNRAFAAAPNGDGTGNTVLVVSDLLPAEIVNYRSTGSTPVLLAGSLALGAVVALGLTLVASVRRRRRDLALLKTLGFTGRQVSASVAVQATVVGFVGLLAGLPLGIALGRWLWVLFAHQIGAVPAPTVPVVALVLVGVVALLLVNAVAILPGRAAARTPTALVLRAE
jgi:ABC-type lipoprotein release transport system permease subunit